ncbi:hypothetical protein O181_116495 [Austropuccinia psidii MF-1]|uniref:DDE Tnp4 domain-containing protein n=1 Tax=Austropuccinia psidii MF-1 TaxID=1389203 RepID=A0A9Q3K8H9_9BASI|nr:hypothetical protein [Austropuccinia psidii MF-1]
MFRYLAGLQVYSSLEEYNLATLLGMRDNDFKQVVRITQDGFLYIYNLIQNSCNGNGASLGWIARSYGISQGRIEISTSMELEGFPGCIGFLDGTTIPLFQRSGWDGEVYYDCKKRYSLNVQIVCDNFKRITDLLSGWPGSCAHSTRYKRMGLYLRPCNFFSPGQYLLTDSAYPLSLHCIPCYKGAAAESRYNRLFNFYLSQSQVRIEHCIGILKARWALLQNLRLACNQASDMIHINKWIYVCSAA